MQIKQGKMWKAVLCTALALSGVTVSNAYAAGNQEPAGINLGLTSFFDGFGPNKPGSLVYIGYLRYAFANRILDNNGNNVAAFNNPKIATFLTLHQLLYTPAFIPAVFNGKGHLGFDVLVPTVTFNTSFDPAPPAPGIQLRDNGTGFGDITFGPYIQFDPVMSGGRPVFSQRFELDILAPVGKYNPGIAINQGANFWSINPYWAATWLPTPKLEVTWRAHYLYNLTNNAPAGAPPTVRSARAGQAAWVNFAISYAVLPSLHLGLNGYYFKQFTSDRWTYRNGTVTSGTEIGDSGKASVFAIGPGLFWQASKTNLLFLDVYFETMARNRSRGDSVSVHWIHSF